MLMINSSLVWSCFSISSPCTATAIWLGEFSMLNPALADCLRRGSFFYVFSAGGDLLQILLASHFGIPGWATQVDFEFFLVHPQQLV